MILRFCCFIFRAENVVRLKKPVHVLRAAETPPALNYALGHHYDDVIETILMGMLYGGQMQTMMPKLKSDELLPQAVLNLFCKIAVFGCFIKSIFFHCPSIITQPVRF